MDKIDNLISSYLKGDKSIDDVLSQSKESEKVETIKKLESAITEKHESGIKSQNNELNEKLKEDIKQELKEEISTQFLELKESIKNLLDSKDNVLIEQKEYITNEFNTNRQDFEDLKEAVVEILNRVVSTGKILSEKKIASTTKTRINFIRDEEGNLVGGEKVEVSNEGEE